MDLTMHNLELCFEEAKKGKWDYVGIRVEMEGFPKTEIIINRSENYDAKMTYYKKAYNDDLTLKANNGIKITGFTYANRFCDIEEDLV